MNWLVFMCIIIHLFPDYTSSVGILIKGYGIWHYVFLEDTTNWVIKIINNFSCLSSHMVTLKDYVHYILPAGLYAPWGWLEKDPMLVVIIYQQASLYKKIY